ncbi:MAG: type II toxin-antitoxin system RelE/ParE family toxin [Cyclobacteriaceae bacterium]
MKVAFKKSFLKSIERLRDKRLKTSILKAISQVEAATEVQKISSIKKLTGFSTYYRIRIGDYRVGLHIADNVVTFVTVDHRRDIYKNFP